MTPIFSIPKCLSISCSGYKKYSLKLEQNNINNIHNEIFIKSILVLIDASDTNNLYNSLNFHAESVIPLNIYLQNLHSQNKKMSYNTIIHMIWYLKNQQEFLEKNNYGFYCLGINDILVINDNKFICINPCIIKELNLNDENKKTKTITFYSPFSRTEFISPEILEITSIPATISHKCFIYSLGSLAIYCFSRIDISKTVFQEIDDTHLVYKDILDILKPISQTKLYWWFLKSLCIDCDKRSFMFI